MMARLTTMRVPCLAAVLLAFASLGCAEPKPPLPAEPAARREPTPAAVDAPSAIPPKLTSARVIVTGVLLRRSDAIEICPGQATGACPGIRVEGKVEDAWISEPGKVAVWRLRGAFDGTTLVLDAPAEPTTLAREPDYRNSCPEFQELKKGVNPDLDLMDAVNAFVSEQAERVAAHWWDSKRQTMVIWVTGDPAELRARMAQRAPRARVCVQGQARFSMAELERAREKADRILREHGVVQSSSSGAVLLNQTVYDVDAIDAATLAELERETGGAVAIVAFIELLEGTLQQLPTPPARGDVAIITKKHRSGGGMSALGRFSVHYDAQLKCVYFATPDARVLPVWPFGYWATSNPLRIYDYDDVLVAQEGQTIELGGGNVELQHVRADNACGAKSAWIGGPVDPVEPRRVR